MPGPRLATDDRFVLGEGPCWDPVRGELLWVDIQAGLVLTGELLDDGRIRETQRVELGETAGAVAVAADGSWVIAGQERLWTRTPDGTLEPWVRLIPEGSGRRLNDGKPDPAGRFLAGSLTPLTRSDHEALWVVDGAGRITTIDDDLTLSNGLAWSADGRTL